MKNSADLADYAESGDIKILLGHPQEFDLWLTNFFNCVGSP